jgi:indole-3-glycerol phosphate synthase
MKDIIVSDVQLECAKRIGADCVLLIKRIFDENLAEGNIETFADHAHRLGLQTLIEVHEQHELQEVLKSRSLNGLIGINNRNLQNLEIDLSTTERLLKTFSKGKNLVISESGINTPEDVQYLKKSGADAFLVGTSIMQSGDIGSKVRQLYLSL